MAESKKITKSSLSQIEETATPSKRLSLRQIMEQMGRSGIYIIQGFLEQDYNANLAGTRGLDVFDKMRKSDAQVRATLDAMELPIRSTDWYIEAGVNEEGETDDLCEEMRDLVEQALFKRMEQSWDDYLREVLTYLPFGFSVFEKVYTADDNGVWIKRLAYRKQTTIYKWEQQDGSAGITQILPSPTTMENGQLASWVSIPAAKILLFSHRREGENYAGVSALRSAYRHWYVKDMLYKFDAIRHERQSVGIAYIKLPKGASQEDLDSAKAILKEIRANEQSGIVMPNPEWEFGFADLQAGNVSDIWRSIDHHNAMIAKNVLAMFMELVSGDGGSRALSEDQSDFFLLALEGVAKHIDDVHSRYLIPELCDLNFDVPIPSFYPRLAHRKLGTVDYSTIGNVLSTLISSGVITVDDELEDWARTTLDLPAKVVDETMLDENGNPLDPNAEIDPNTGLPIDPNAPQLDANGNPIPEQGIDENGEPMVDDQGNPIDQDGNPIEQGGFSEGEDFRIVSEETKQKISESLKKALPGDSTKPPVRKGRRKRSLTQRSIGGMGRIAQSRARRLKKAGKRLTTKGQAKILKKIQEASTQVGGGAPPKVTKKRAKKAAKQPAAAPKPAIGYTEAQEEAYERYKAFCDWPQIIQLQNAGPRDPADPEPRARPWAFNDIEPTWRPLTFAEKKVNFTSLRKALSSAANTFDSEIARITVEQKADILAQVKRAVESNDIAAVGKIKAKYTGDLAAALTSIQMEMFDTGKKSASLEIGVKPPPTAREISGALRVQNEKLVGQYVRDIETAAATAVTQVAARKGGSITSTGTVEAVQAAAESMTKAIEKGKGAMQTLSIIGTLNLGRASIFERYPEEVAAMQYSAIIDDATTDICLSLDGRVVKPGSAEFYQYSPPRHFNCRSLWVEILRDEDFVPEFTGIPKSIPANPTIDTFEDLAAPVLPENSFAIKILEQELAEREEKLKEYQDTGKFLNRVDAHKQRIESLKQSLKNVSPNE